MKSHFPYSRNASTNQYLRDHERRVEVFEAVKDAGALTPRSLLRRGDELLREATEIERQLCAEYERGETTPTYAQDYSHYLNEHPPPITI
jgi:hypothetical protein